MNKIILVIVALIFFWLLWNINYSLQQIASVSAYQICKGQSSFTSTWNFSEVDLRCLGDNK